jgi:drug/metabolite transporter (DMT)-like permease
VLHLAVGQDIYRDRRDGAHGVALTKAACNPAVLFLQLAGLEICQLSQGLAARMSIQPPSQITGYAAAWCIVFVWSFWLIVSRIASNSGLTIYDLAAMRYGLALIVALPLSIYFKPWKGLSAGKILVISFILGPVYILPVFGAFLYAPAAHGGIFMNGMLPLIGIALGFAMFRAVPSMRQGTGAVLILFSAIVLAWDGAVIAGPQAWIGDLLFIVGALFFSTYVLLSERWTLNATQIIFCGTLVNAVIYLPIWAIWLPSGIADAPRDALLLQAVYQGFVPNLVGLIFIAHASRTIGNGNTSSILAAVPGASGILAALILGEDLTVIGGAALTMLTVGLLLSVRRRSRQTA